MADRSVKVTLRGDVGDFNRGMVAAGASARGFAKQLETTDHRMNGLVQTSLALGPALVPIGAAAIPAISGLSNQLAFAAAGAGVAAVAFSGVGEALKAVNDFAIEPTDANLQALSQTMQTLGPAGREFVMFLQEMRPQMQELQNIAQAGLFPGLQAGLTDLLTLMPKFEGIVGTIAQAMGDIAAEAGANLAGPGWTEFFDFLEAEARPTLISMAQTMGNFARGFAELWMAFDPLSDQFSAGFLQMSRDFATWADGLSQTQGFRDFVAYIQDTLPQVGATFAAFGNMLLQLLQAAAPVGAAALAVLEPIFDVIAGIANTPIGTTLIGLAAGLAAVGRARAILTAANLSPLMTLARTDFRTPAQGLTTLGSRIPIIRGLTEASRGLKVAQDQLAISQQRAVLAQSALIPTPAKLAALRQYGDAQKNVAVASKEMAAAQRRAVGAIAGGAAIAGGLALAMSDLDDKMGLTNTTTGAMVGLIGGPWGAAVGAGIGLALDFAAANDDVGDSLDRVNAIAADGSVSIKARIAAVDAEIAAMRRLRAEKLAGESIGTVAQSEVTGGTSTRGPNVGADDAAIKEAVATRKALAAAAQEALFAEFGLTSAMRGTSQATRDQTAALLENVASKNAAADATLAAFDAETRYREALKAARDQANKNNAGIRGDSDAVLANRAALSGLAAAWNRVADSGKATAGKMQAARAEFIKVAEGMGIGSRKARQLADDMLHIPKPKLDINTKSLDDARRKGVDVRKSLNDVGRVNARPKIDVQSNAEKAAAAARRAIASVRSKTVFINTVYRRGGSANPGGRFEGGTVPVGFAGGGVVPGTPPPNPRVDNVLGVGAHTGKHIMVRSGEWIVNEPQSRKNDEWLRAINNGLNLGPYPQFAPHYNEGGIVGGGSATVAAPMFDKRELARAVTDGLQGATFNLSADGRRLQLTMRRG